LPDTDTFASNPSLIGGLNLRDIEFHRNENVLFSGISASLDSGDILQVEGPNGSGKTTLLRLITMVLNPCMGEITWQGKNVTHVREKYLKDVLFLGHQSGLNKSLSAEENLIWWRRLNKSNSLVNSDALKRTGLIRYKGVACSHLSAGQLRRAALARLYVAEAKLWILDEPFSALDKEGSSELKILLLDHSRRGGIVVLSTHQNLEINNMKRISLASSQQAS
jgi:heme exporter protein A|tara:strand:+ start:5735 stop:6400 length:666 start_codon:yes stop_codon:yes gene_type:complete